MKHGCVIALVCLLACGGLCRGQDLPSGSLLFPEPQKSGDPISLCSFCCDQEIKQDRTWVNGEYLLWWMTRAPLPGPLATTGSVADAVPGGLGQPNTQVLLGNSSQDYGAFSGGRLTAGYWLNEEQTVGIEARGFLLAERGWSETFTSDANGNPGIFRPVNDVVLGQDSFTVSYPGKVSGTLNVSSSSQLWGTEVNALVNLYQEGNSCLHLVGGFGYLDLRENLELTRFSRDFGALLADPSNPGPPLGNAEPAGSILITGDSFRTRNQFYGGQIGAQGRYDLGQGLFMEGRALVGLGVNHQTVDITGSTTQIQPGQAPVNFPGGVLATVSNSGQYHHDAFSVVPQGEIKLGYQVNEFLHFSIGYNALYWNNVVRPGNQVNPNVDERGIATGNPYTPGFHANLPPSPSFKESGLWVQGMSFEVGLRY